MAVEVFTTKAISSASAPISRALASALLALEPGEPLVALARLPEVGPDGLADRPRHRASGSGVQEDAPGRRREVTPDLVPGGHRGEA
jgi:hypothetical protein